MPKYSFNIYCHLPRVEELRQTLRFLVARDPVVLESEVIVVAHGFDRFEFPGLTVRVLPVAGTEFNKPVMVNAGVAASAGEVVVLLDGDRILPPGYFARTLPLVAADEFVTPRRLYRLRRRYTDAEIAAAAVERDEDFRLPEVVPGRKNAFSGHVAFHRSAFEAAGGMDESFANYGCSDTDFTIRVQRAGMRITYTEDEELHLWHPKGMTYTEFYLTNMRSAFRLACKWGLPVQDDFLDYAKKNKYYIMM